MSLATLLREIETFLADLEHQDLATASQEELERAVRAFIEARTQETADRVASLMAGHAAWAYEGGAEQAFKHLGLRIRDSPVPTARLEPVMEQAAAEISGTFGSIANGLLEDLHDGIERGRSYPEIRTALTRRLDSYFKDGIPFENKGKWRREIKVAPNGKMTVTKHRIKRNVTISTTNYADILTKTVAKRAYAQGHIAGYESAGIKAWRYACVADERTRLRHLALHGRVFVIGSPDEALALEVMGEPRCRCRPVPYYGDPNLDTPEEVYRQERARWAKEAMHGLDPDSDEAKYLEKVASGKMVKPPEVPKPDPLATLQPFQPATKPKPETIWGPESPRNLAAWIPDDDGPVTLGTNSRLTASEALAVNNYTEMYYDPINAYFRKGEAAFLEACKFHNLKPAEVRENITLLESAMAKGRLAKDRMLWRGIKGKHDEIGLRIGDKFTDKAYSSWSYDQDIAEGFTYAFPKHPETGKPTKIIFRYQARQGEHALFIGDEGAVAEEAEIILGRGRQWRVADIVDHNQGEHVLREIVLDAADHLGPGGHALRDWEPWLKTRMGWTREAVDTLTAKQPGYRADPRTLAARILYGRDLHQREFQKMGAALIEEGLISIDGPPAQAPYLLEQIQKNLAQVVHQDVIRRAGPVKVRMLANVRRAYYDPDLKAIFLPTGTGPKDTWRIFLHEYGHHLEHQNSRYAHNAMMAIRARDNGFKLRKMRDLYPDHGYRADEITFAGFDHVHPYAGKVYPLIPGNKNLVGALKEGDLRAIRAGETISAGLEHFRTAHKAKTLLETDPEYFSFLLTIMAGLG